MHWLFCSIQTNPKWGGSDRRERRLKVELLLSECLFPDSWQPEPPLCFTQEDKPSRASRTNVSLVITSWLWWFYSKGLEVPRNKAAPKCSLNRRNLDSSVTKHDQMIWIGGRVVHLWALKQLVCCFTPSPDDSPACTSSVGSLFTFPASSSSVGLDSAQIKPQPEACVNNEVLQVDCWFGFTLSFGCSSSPPESDHITGTQQLHGDRSSFCFYTQILNKISERFNILRWKYIVWPQKIFERHFFYIRDILGVG